MKRTTTFLSLLALSAGLLAQSSVKTECQYLSGRGCDDMVQWDFMCTAVKAFLSASQDKLMISWNSGIMMRMTGW